MTHSEKYGISEKEFHRLARYNDELNHGIAHRQSYREWMGQLQVKYDAAVTPNAQPSTGDQELPPGCHDVYYGDELRTIYKK